jgi:NADP oxidoreductase coenzyme F420-dependent
MKIGTIGAGKLGAAMADRLVKMGHAVMPSFSRDLAMALAFTMEPYTSSPALPGKRDRDRGRRSWQGTQNTFICWSAAAGSRRRCRGI